MIWGLSMSSGISAEGFTIAERSSSRKTTLFSIDKLPCAVNLADSELILSFRRSVPALIEPANPGAPAWRTLTCRPETALDSAVAPKRSREMKRRRGLHLAPTLQSLGHRHLIGELDLGAYGQSHRNARHAKPKRLEEFGKIDGGCFTLHRRAGGND